MFEPGSVGCPRETLDEVYLAERGSFRQRLSAFMARIISLHRLLMRPRLLIGVDAQPHAPEPFLALAGKLELVAEEWHQAFVTTTVAYRQAASVRSACTAR